MMFRFILNLIILTNIVFEFQTAVANTEISNEQEYYKGSLVAYKATNEQAYFTVPQSWYLESDDDRLINNIWIEKTEPNRNSLNLILKPNFKMAKEWEKETSFLNRDKNFYKMPYTSESITITFINSEFPIKSIITPVVGRYKQETILVRIELDDNQLNILKRLSLGGISLIGSHKISFLSNTGSSSIEIPLLIDISQRTFQDLEGITSPSLLELIEKITNDNINIKLDSAILSRFYLLETERNVIDRASVRLQGLNNISVARDSNTPDIIEIKTSNTSISNLELTISHFAQNNQGRDVSLKDYKVFGNFTIRINARNMKTTVKANQIHKITRDNRDATRLFPELISIFQSENFLNKLSLNFPSALLEKIENHILD